MKVAFYIGRLNRGGAETLLVDIFSKKRALPFEPVCVYRTEGNISDEFRATGVKLLKLPRKRSWVLYLIRLRKLFIKERFDVIHAQTSLNAIIAILCTVFTRIKVVYTFHGFSFSKAPKILRSFVFKGCDMLLFVSEYEKRYYLERGSFGAEKKCQVVYNGINFEKIPLRTKGEPLTRPINMCMVGSFCSGRNQLFLCQFLNYLKERGIDFHFTFIGGARDSERSVYDDCVDYCLQNGLSDKVEFAGLCDNVPEMLSKMDAFIYSTRHDSFGISVIESIASGLPTFANDWDVVMELTNNGQLAMLYKTADEESLYVKLINFMNDYDQCIIKAHENALVVREKYSIENHIDNLANIYEQLL